MGPSPGIQIRGRRGDRRALLLPRRPAAIFHDRFAERPRHRRKGSHLVCRKKRGRLVRTEALRFGRKFRAACTGNFRWTSRAMFISTPAAGSIAPVSRTDGISPPAPLPAPVNEPHGPEEINTGRESIGPFISPEGDYLIYTKMRAGAPLPVPAVHQLQGKRWELVRAAKPEREASDRGKRQHGQGHAGRKISVLPERPGRAAAFRAASIGSTPGSSRRCAREKGDPLEPDEAAFFFIRLLKRSNRSDPLTPRDRA